MTVAELITELLVFNQDLEVWVGSDEYPWRVPAPTIKFNVDSRKEIVEL